MRAAATAEHERTLGKLARKRDLLLERLLVDDRRLGLGKRKRSGLGHRLAVVAPSPRHPQEPSGELRPQAWHW